MSASYTEGQEIADRMARTGLSVEKLYDREHPGKPMGAREAELARWKASLSMVRNARVVRS